MRADNGVVKGVKSREGREAGIGDGRVGGRVGMVLVMWIFLI